MDWLEAEPVLELWPEEVVVLDVDPHLDPAQHLLAVDTAVVEAQCDLPGLRVELALLLTVIVLHLQDPGGES